jgi:hypothetical protein
MHPIIQYVHTKPYATRTQYVPLKTSSTFTPQCSKKPVSTSSHSYPHLEHDLKFGRYPFDWYRTDRNDAIVNDNIQLGYQRTVSNAKMHDL